MLEFLFTKTPLGFLTQSLWRDEAFSYLMAKESISNIFVLSANDFTPPIHSLMLKFWIWIFGSSEIALRSMSLVFYFISAYFFYLILSKVLKIKGLWKHAYMLLFFLNPMLHYFAFEARAYSLLVLLTLMSFYFLLKKGMKSYIAVSVVGLYTHYFMALIILIQALYVFLIDKRRKKIFKYISVMVLFFLPWVAFVIKQNNIANEPFWINDISKESLKLIPSILYSGYESGFYYLNDVVSNLNLTIYLYIFSGLVLYFQGVIKNRKIFLLLLIWGFLPAFLTLFLSNYKPVFLARYLIISTPALILLLILINEKLNKIFKYVLFFILLIQTFNFSALQADYRQKLDYKKTISEIRLQSNQKDFLYVTSELDYHVAKYYFEEDRVYIYGKDYNDIPNFVGKVLIPKNSIKQIIPLYPSKAFILYPDLTYDIKTVF
ncbi:hypothetical protein A3F29_01255 [Candidatus Roizmanbacteria bacterium RIFCSPHIGHO2_12_FULL_33_9]|uniref:Uncharacterized protein n=1 Tax=Candidatus Roizmanbacteria bacterium RIFCSPHIGHO2_12_FULL_33_9 TaxID=1802045 RepID=A0A1F7HKR2_9BACT|nr:MAG: hypothetical protein A3F29_01255 [Candidatus Roizmanbacteria bacterium RIFCSPHIGHO2_12_FULL_33_9]